MAGISMAMCSTGLISRKEVDRTFRDLSGPGRSGTLTVRRGSAKAWLQFHGGRLVSARDHRGIDLARWVRELELACHESLEPDSTSAAISEGETLAERWVSSGVLTRETIDELVRSTVCDLVCELLAAEDATWSFIDGPPDPAEGDADIAACLGDGLCPVMLLTDASRRAEEFVSLGLQLPASDSMWVWDAARQNEAPSSSGARELVLERRAIELFDGSRSVAQVLEQLPCSRFAARRCIVQLASRGALRPCGDSAHLAVEDAAEGVAADGLRASIEEAESALETDPNNRQLHHRLAGLFERQGRFTDAAQQHRKFARSCLEIGDLSTARNHLTISLELDPGDDATWHTLWSCVREIGEPQAVLGFGLELLAHLRETGSTEGVRDHLLGMVELFPSENELRLALGETQLQLGEHKRGSRQLLFVAQNLSRGEQSEEAESVLVRLLELDPENERVRRLLLDTRSGRLQRRRKLRSRLLRKCGMVLVLCVCVWFILRELSAQNELLIEMRSVLADQLLEGRRYDEAIDRIERVRERYPFSPTASGQGSALIDSMQAGPDLLDPETPPLATERILPASPDDR